MGAEHIIGLRLTADNKEAVAAIKAVRDEQDKLGVSARTLSSEADRLNTAQSRMSDSYRQVSIAAHAANMSVAQYTNAMRQVPMQFTDIVTGLISGQSPFTVLVQQGGQLKDTFGGVGNAATAMGTYIMGLVNPVSVVAAEALKKRNDATALKNEMLGKTAAEQAALQVAAIDREIAALKEAKAALNIADAYDTQRVALQNLIDQKNREKGLVADAANGKNSNTAEKRNEKSTESAISAGVGATTNAFFADNGRSFTENFTGSFKSALEPSINKLVAQLIVNAITTQNAMTSNISTSDWVMAIIAAVSTQFGNQARSMGTTTNVSGTLAGATSGNQSKAMQLDQTWFEGQKNWNVVTQASRATLNAYSADIRNSAEMMYAAGDVLGVAGMRAKSLSINVSTAGNVTDALARSVGVQLVPAIVLFQREGENLAATAKRLTDEFKATNDLINAVGVSSGKVFGGFGLQSVAAREDMIAAAGGLQAFSSASKSYIQNFLTPAQQLQPALDDVAKTFNNLHISGISTNAEFSAYVKAQMELGNTSVVGKLMAVADSFNTITKSAGDANNQLNALLNKDNFTSLVDYKRAMALNGAGSIASAQLSAAQKAAQDQAGTAAFTSSNAAAIAAANAAQTTTTTPQTTTGNGTFDLLLQKIGDLFDGLGKEWNKAFSGLGKEFNSAFDGLGKEWNKAFDGLGKEWNKAFDGLGKEFNNFVNGIINGFKDALKGIGGAVGGGGGGQIIPGIDNPFSGLSDPRLKENVRQVGTTAHGLGQYDFSYIGDPTHARYRGVMSDEVRRVMPSAVSVGRDGFDRVNYGMLGIQMQKLPSFDVGTNFVPRDMVAQIHGGEEITPRPYVDLQRAAREETNALLTRIMATNAEMAKELALLRAEAKASQRELVINTKETVRVLDKFDVDGMPAVRVVF